MRNKYALLYLFLFILSCNISAQKVSSVKSIDPVNVNTQQKPIVKKQEVLKQIAQIDSHLSAIEIKRNYVLSDPTEKAMALEQGWFAEMEKIEKSLLNKKNELKALIND
ncbi:MAG: hypothetical protein DBW72_05455 [Flavobacteriales bacterium]|nr:MAG: hypothetical protein DBW72_05455 [Flavobacteriales bacterium]